MQVLHQGGGAGSVTSTLHLSLGLARAGFQVRFVCPPAPRSRDWLGPEDSRFIRSLWPGPAGAANAAALAELLPAIR